MKPGNIFFLLLTEKNTVISFQDYTKDSVVFQNVYKYLIASI